MLIAAVLTPFVMIVISPNKNAVDQNVIQKKLESIAVYSHSIRSISEIKENILYIVYRHLGH